MNRRRLVAASLATGLAGCGGRRIGTGTAGADDGDRDVRTDGGADGNGDPDPERVGYTFGRPTGNRVVGGRGGLPDADPVDVAVDGDPAWIAAVPVPGASAALWAVVLADGSTVGVRQSGRAVERVDLPEAGLAGARGPRPPAVAADPPGLLAVDGGAPLSHPVRVGDALVGVSAAGAVLVADRDGTVRRRHAVDALLDARPVTDGRRVAVLSGATGRYDHGVLGDAVEAERLTFVAIGAGEAGADATDPAADAVTHRSLPDEAVVEGLSPIVHGGDPLVTLSDARTGARLALLTDDGVVAGPPVGAGFRWRHQLAVAPFGPDGGTEVAAVRTPHIGGVAEFYARDGDRLDLVATRPGYSTHAIGSRNLDAALAGDLDADGATELLVPTDDGDALAGLRRVDGDGDGGDSDGDDADDGGVAEPWRVALPDRSTGNLAGVAVDGVATVGVALPGRLRLYPGG